MGAISINDFHPIIFDSLDSELICSMGLKTDESPGPSGLDATSWKHLCTSFRLSFTEPCDALVAYGRRICTSFVYPTEGNTRLIQRATRPSDS